MIKEKAFCPDCLRILSHQRYHSSFASWMNVFSLGVFRRCGLGPWFCRQCGRKSFWLPKSTHKLIERVAHDSDQRIAAAAENQDDETDIAGNVFLEEQSLARRVELSNKFSEKYRDNIVERIISSRTLISRVCNDLEVTEADIQFWIKQWVQRRFELLRRHPEMAEKLWESIDSEGKYNHPGVSLIQGITIIDGTVEE